jgi:hypothetical protein
VEPSKPRFEPFELLLGETAVLAHAVCVAGDAEVVGCLARIIYREKCQPDLAVGCSYC